MPQLSPTPYLLTTDPGLEGLLADECVALCQKAELPLPTTERHPFGRRGLLQVTIEASPEKVVPLLRQLRLAYHVMRYLHHLELVDPENLDPLAEALRQLDLPKMATARSFRITTKRVGQHAFDSYAVASLAGRIMQERFGTPVDLRGYEVDLRVDVYERQVWIGWQLTRHSLSHRFENRPYYRSVSLKPTFAHALLRFARIPDDVAGNLLDPFCGAGTILLEAAEVFPGLQLFGSDRYEEPVAGAQANLAKFNLAHRAEIQQVEMSTLSQHYPAGQFDYIVTNPPFGLRMAQKVDLRRFYQTFLTEADTLLAPGGTLTLLMLKAANFRQAVARSPLRVIEFHRVEVGGKEMRVYRLGKKRQVEVEGS
jgi:tRNA (guanine6-N2)-methyltransferase